MGHLEDDLTEAHRRANVADRVAWVCGDANYAALPTRKVIERESRQPDNPKDIAGRAKAPFELIPAAALPAVALVMKHGAEKYGPYNWRDIAVAYRPYLGAAMRHINAVIDGQDTDPESGLPHLAHAAAGLMILLDAIVTGNVKDDRPKPNPALAKS